MMANIESHSLNIWGCVLYIETQVSGTGIILKRGELSLTIQRHCIYQTSVLNGNEMKQNEFSPIFRDDSLGDGTWWLLNSIQQNKSVPPSSSFMNGEQFHQSQQSFSLCIKKKEWRYIFVFALSWLTLIWDRDLPGLRQGIFIVIPFLSTVQFQGMNQRGVMWPTVWE